MNEASGNLWEVEADLRCITTNGAVRRDGACVMGRGCAKEAKEKFPGVDFKLGRLLSEHGNRVMRLISLTDGSDLASFPVKHHWRDAADPELIRRSAYQLLALADKFGYQNVVVPRPGCGNGRLSWAEVRGVLAGILDDRFTVVTFPSKKARRQSTPEPEMTVVEKVEQENIYGPYKIELRSYGSADDLGLGRYRSTLLPEAFHSKEWAEKDISRREAGLRASGAMAIMVPVPAGFVAKVS